MHRTNCNPSAFISQSKEAFVSHSDVFCAACAQKQEHKLLELSQFEASADANWDVEIEAFRQNLETRYDLCSPCKTKVRSRILQSDSKVLPQFLSWCQNRHQKPHTPTAEQSRKDSAHVDEGDSGFYYSLLRFLLRLFSVTGWTLLWCARIYSQAVSRFCYVPCGPYNQLSSTLVRLLRYLGLRSDHCGRLADFELFMARVTSSELLLALLCATQTFLVVLHWRCRRPAVAGFSKTSPFWILLDTCLLVYSARCLLSLSLPSPFKSASAVGKQFAQQVLSSTPPIVFLAITGCTVCASFGVILWHWLPFCAQDLVRQKQRVQAAWPVGFDAQSVVSQQSTRVGRSFLRPGSVVAAAPISSMRNLSLGSAKQQRTAGPASAFLRPSRLSPQPTERCFSAVLPPTTAHSFSSRPYSLGGSPTYAETTVPLHFPFRRSPDSWQRANDEREEVDSHITSISQRVGGQQQYSPPSLLSGTSERHSRRRRHRRNTGLLRCCIYFLFGRIDSWEDVKAELICLANAVMVAALLMMIAHLFYTLGPTLFL
ncbi:hypothetical protein AAHC03_05300 [Spirometra sp. Aus1]